MLKSCNILRPTLLTKVPNVIINLIEEYSREYSFLEEYKEILKSYQVDKFDGVNNPLKIFSFYYWNVVQKNEYRVEWYKETDPHRTIKYMHTDQFGTFIKYLKYKLMRKKRRWELTFGA